MNHDDFFALAIDPDTRVADAAAEAELDAHRKTCAECRELEKDYHELRRMSRAVPGDCPPPFSELEERIQEIAQERLGAERRAAARDRSVRRKVLVTVGLPAVLFFGLTLGETRAPGPAVGLKTNNTPSNQSKLDASPRTPMAPLTFAVRAAGIGPDDTLDVALDPEAALGLYRTIEQNSKLSPEIRAEASLAKARCLLALGKTDVARAVAKDVRDTLRGTERQRRLAAVFVEDLDRR